MAHHHDTQLQLLQDLCRLTPMAQLGPFKGKMAYIDD